MTEWLMVPLSKSGRQECLVGSNPTLSANREYRPEFACEVGLMQA